MTSWKVLWFDCADIKDPNLLFIASVMVKVGMIGDSQIGKTSLMVKYVEGTFDEDYIQTLGKESVLSFSLSL